MNNSANVKTKNNNAYISIILMILTVISWGVMFPVVKHSLIYVDAVHITLIRSVGISIILVTILVYKEGLKSLLPGKNFLKLWLFGTAGFLGSPLLSYAALDYIEPQQGAIFTALMPLITVLILWVVNKKRPSNVTLITIVLSFIGVVLVITKGHLDAFHSSNLFASLVMFAGVISLIIYTIGGNSFPEFSALKYTTLACFWGTMSSILVSIAADVSHISKLPTLEHILIIPYSLLYIICIGGTLSMVAWNFGIKNLGAANGVLFINLVPITALIISLFNGYNADSITIIGMIITIIAVIINNIYTRISNK